MPISFLFYTSLLHLKDPVQYPLANLLQLLRNRQKSTLKKFAFSKVCILNDFQFFNFALDFLQVTFALPPSYLPKNFYSSSYSTTQPNLTKQVVLYLGTYLGTYLDTYLDTYLGTYLQGQQCKGVFESLCQMFNCEPTVNC